VEICLHGRKTVCRGEKQFVGDIIQFAGVNSSLQGADYRKQHVIVVCRGENYKNQGHIIENSR
jgi:hypothetical protein